VVGREGEARQFSSGEQPLVGVAAGPSGKVAARASNGDIWMMNSDGTQQSVIVPDARNVAAISFCGDSYLVFDSRRSGKNELLRTALDGSNATHLADNPRFCSCSPDGKSVFFTSNAAASVGVWRVPVAGGEPTKIAAGSPSGNGAIGVSSDDKFVAFGFQEFTPAPVRKVGVLSADGGPLLKGMVLPPNADSNPGSSVVLRWSPDNKALQYTSTKGGVTNIWELPLSGGEPRQVTHFTSGLIFDYAWEPGGKKLFVARGDLSSDVILFSASR
jgi:Tol biopolymer transport system component